ncbi:GFA family protein [Sphingomonas sp.]|jgi:hypothetical protein|uniref:GFA family protein n=1 Tax=Sphingomonas sp. TaxID=28214 RepID=UPI002EDBB77F
MHLTGSCHCGAIRLEAEADPAGVSVCHCGDCQKLSGSPWRTSIQVRAEHLRLEGVPAIYVKTADSGTKRAQAFCGTCGSPIYATTLGDEQVFALRLGIVDQRAQLPPVRQIWCGSALPWALDISGLPASQGQ